MTAPERVDELTKILAKRDDEIAKLRAQAILDKLYIEVLEDQLGNARFREEADNR